MLDDAQRDVLLLICYISMITSPLTGIARRYAFLS
jgi:hypothetical protein